MVYHFLYYSEACG